METTTLKIRVQDVVAVWEAPTRATRPKAARLGLYRHQFVFAMGKDEGWAPGRSRAPSVTIDFELLEAPF